MPVSDEYKLASLSEILFRQVHPSHLDEMGRVATLAFVASKEHKFQVSVDRESKITAAEATASHVRLKPSAGAWGVSVEECQTAGVHVYDDPDDEKPAHAVIDQNPLGRGARNRVATRLASDARKRGCLHPVSEPEAYEGPIEIGSTAIADAPAVLPQLVELVEPQSEAVHEDKSDP